MELCFIVLCDIKKKVFSCFGNKKGADTKVASALFFSEDFDYG